MFEVESFAIAGVSLIALTFGLVQFIKELFGLEGKWVTGLSASVGAGLFGLYRALEFIPEPWNTVALIVVGSVTFGLAASGFYKFGTRD